MLFLAIQIFACPMNNNQRKCPAFVRSKTGSLEAWKLGFWHAVLRTLFQFTGKTSFFSGGNYGGMGGPSHSGFRVIIDNRLTAGNRCEMYFKLILGA